MCKNQCQLGNPCDGNATCASDYSADGFTCTCNAGYHGNGKRQTELDGIDLPDDINLDFLIGFGQKDRKEAKVCVKFLIKCL